jgi:hypothetical protein
MDLLTDRSNHYLSRQPEPSPEDKILLRTDGVFCKDLMDAGFEFKEQAITSVVNFCRKHGVDSSKISKFRFIYSHDCDMKPDGGSFDSLASTSLRILELPDGQVEARVFMGSFFEITPEFKAFKERSNDPVAKE